MYIACKGVISLDLSYSAIGWSIPVGVNHQQASGHCIPMSHRATRLLAGLLMSGFSGLYKQGLGFRWGLRGRQLRGDNQVDNEGRELAKSHGRQLGGEIWAA